MRTIGGQTAARSRLPCESHISSSMSQPVCELLPGRAMRADLLLRVVADVMPVVGVLISSEFAVPE